MAKPKPIKTRRWRPEDIPGIIECNQVSYGDYPPEYVYTPRQYELQLQAFPEGQFVAMAGDLVVGYATSLIVNLDDIFYTYTVDEITGAGTFSNHNSLGDTLYGADMAVHPDYQRRGVSQLLYKQRKALMRRYNLRRMIAYGRIPGYKAYAGRMTAEQYVERVTRGEIKDPALNAHLKAGYTVKRVQLDITVDYSSLNYSTYLEMLNPDYNYAKKRVSAPIQKHPARRVRVCAAQYLMRPVHSWQEFEDSVGFFVETAYASHCHFLLFPEFTTYQLISMLQAPDMKQIVRELAGLTDRYVEMFTRFARQYNLYIIGGSHPVEREGKIYNTAFLFTPTGKFYTQEKLHISPIERAEGEIEAGEAIRIFDTPLCRIAIQICYDIEFPEIARLLTLSGVEILFVPFLTEEKKGYYRVRYCAHARAVENFVYVVMTGTVGNMRTRVGSFMNYGQAAVLTPCDFAFPEKGVEGEADPNVEAVVISELGLSTLIQQRQIATVRPLHDRRPDLYSLEMKSKIEIIRVE